MSKQSSDGPLAMANLAISNPKDVHIVSLSVPDSAVTGLTLIGTSMICASLTLKVANALDGCPDRKDPAQDVLNHVGANIISYVVSCLQPPHVNNWTKQ